MLSYYNSELSVPPEIPKRKRGRPRKTALVPPPPIPVPVIPKDTTFLSHAPKIVKAMMDLTRIGPFMERPDDSFFGLHDYYTVIEKPMWIREICRKVGNREYFHLKEIVNDVELMLENCYRFWGPNHRISRLGFMIENALEKTIKSLPQNVRICIRGPEEQEEDERIKLELARKNMTLYGAGNESTNGFKPEQGFDMPSLVLDESINFSQISTSDSAIRLTDDNPYAFTEEDDPHLKKGFESRLLNRVLTYGPTRIKIKLPDVDNPDELYAWEQETFVHLQKDIDLTSLWQLVTIGHFLKVCGPLLDLEELTQVEVERMLLIPKQSFSLALVMTTMLCPRFARSQLYSSPVMCYDVWNKLLRNKLELWYKIYYTHEHPAKVFEKSGVEPNFWAAMGDVNPLWEKDFDQLEFYQKVWIMHSLCTYILHSVKSLEEILQGYEGDDLRGQFIGRQGKYDYWSMFSPEIRIYRQAYHQNEWNMDMMTPDNITRTQDVCDYFNNSFETAGYLPPPWVYPCDKDFKLVAWNEETLESLIEEMKGKSIQSELIKYKESVTDKHREYTLHGLHMLYKHVTNDMNQDTFVITKSIDYWISKNKGPTISSPSHPKDILFGIGNEGPNLDILYAIGKRERKSRIPKDSVIEEPDVGDGSSGSDWERERTRRSKRIKLSKERKQEEAKRRRQMELLPYNMYPMGNHNPPREYWSKKGGRKYDMGRYSPISDASTQSCPSPPFWHPDQEEEAFYNYYQQQNQNLAGQYRSETQEIKADQLPALADHAINPPFGPIPENDNEMTMEEVVIGTEDQPLDGTEPDAVLNRGIRPDGTYGFYLSVGETVLPLSDEAACRLVLLQEGIETT